MSRRCHDWGISVWELIRDLSFEGFQKRLMEFYRKGKERPLMDALTGMMAEGIMTLCNKCQSDRLVCALRPLCGDRKYTSLLADMGATEDEIKKTHSFCFSNHLSRLRDIRENKEAFGSVKDAKYPLATFLQVVLSDAKKGISAPSVSLDLLEQKKLFKILEQPVSRAWGKFMAAYGGDIYLVLGNKNGIIQIDLDRKVVCFNPENELIRDNAQLRAVLELLSALFSPNLSIEEAVKGLDYLSFPIEIRTSPQAKSPSNEDVAKLIKKLHGEGIFATALETAKGSLRLMVELRLPRSELSVNRLGFSYGYLRNMMQLVSKLANRRPTKE